MTIGKFGTQLGFGYMIPNPTMIQIYLDKFGTWSSLGIKCFKLNLSQIYPGGFGNVPNLTIYVLNYKTCLEHGQFGASSVPNLTMF